MLGKGFCLLSLLLFYVIAKPIDVVASSATEFQIKAAYLYHFTRLVDWPTSAFDSSNPTFKFCVIGENPFGDQLSPMGVRRTYNNLPIEIKFPESDSAIRGCHLLYIAVSDSNRERVIVRKFRNSPVLTISSELGFISRSGIIGFVTVNKRVRIEINRDAARRANIKLSAKLLEVATNVIDKTE